MSLDRNGMVWYGKGNGLRTMCHVCMINIEDGEMGQVSESL